MPDVPNELFAIQCNRECRLSAIQHCWPGFCSEDIRSSSTARFFIAFVYYEAGWSPVFSVDPARRVQLQATLLATRDFVCPNYIADSTILDETLHGQREPGKENGAHKSWSVTHERGLGFIITSNFRPDGPAEVAVPCIRLSISGL